MPSASGARAIPLDRPNIAAKAVIHCEKPTFQTDNVGDQDEYLATVFFALVN